MRGAQHCSFSIVSSLRRLKPSFAPFNFSVYNPIKTLRPVRAQKLLPARQESWLANASPPLHLEEGPIELPSSDSSIFASSDDPTPIQIATSLLLTGAISVFLFRSLRLRLKRAKELVKNLGHRE
ncbi:unnamed protein product [Cuscuta campestris]|uniref:Uncharacterized protein n=1 Tax=Cuscuta campestris TaxID=132261 RepID=A0A484K1P0_9ASTE|nr:unnamed protein product [Cuscuta campestris]